MHSLAVAILVFLLGAFTSGASETNVRVFAIGYPSKGISIVCRISKAKAEAQSKWTPESPTPPPLSIYEASVRAKWAVEHRGMPLTEWRIQDCSLKRFHHDGYRDRWCYVFEFLHAKPSRPLKREDEIVYRGVVVLMDGTVVEPTTEPYSLSPPSTEEVSRSPGTEPRQR